MNRDYLILHNGVLLPQKGIGTYQLAPGDETYQSVLVALQQGARHIDTSIIYRNEKDVGRAIVASGINRNDIFVTGKLPPHIKNHDGVMRMFERSLNNLGLDYLDAYIINAPGPFDDLDGDYDEGNVIAYKALEELYRNKRVRAIGVSQFHVPQLTNILSHCDIVPHINQISFFVGHTQPEIVSFCLDHDIAIQAFSPLGKGYLLSNDKLVSVAKRYGVTPAQIALAYNMEKRVASIPKAKTLSHIIANNELDIALDPSDIASLDQIVNDPRRYDD